MKISGLFMRGMTVSYEVYPPKAEQPIEPLIETLARLSEQRPDFISCTYGAGGTNKGRNAEVCALIQKNGVTPLMHLTCVGNTEAEMRSAVNEYRALGIENVLALRGDLPKGWEGTRGEFSHADGLLSFLSRENPNCCYAGACYPEKHIQARSMEEDIARLVSKQRNGAEYLITQLCYDVSAFERFRDSARRAGVTVPIAVGVMPALRRDPLIRMTVFNGCSIPAELAALIGTYGENEADFLAAGKEYTAKLIGRFITAGAEGLHIYSMNKHKDVADIAAMAGIGADRA